MRLSGPRPHSVGGAESTIGKWIVRVDTDAGIHGLGEAENFMGVGEAIAHIKPHLVGRSRFQIRSLGSEILYGALPPHTPEQGICRSSVRVGHGACSAITDTGARSPLSDYAATTRFISCSAAKL